MYKSTPCSATVKKLHPEECRKKYRDSQPYHVPRKRDLRAVSTKWDISIKSFPLRAQKTLWVENQKDWNNQWGWKTPRK